MFNIDFTPEALEDLKILRKHDRQQVMGEMESQLHHQADVETRNRKRLRPNQLAEWELRVGAFRVFYDIVDQGSVVKIVAVGYKQRSKLFVHGKEYEL